MAVLAASELAAQSTDHHLEAVRVGPVAPDLFEQHRTSDTTVPARATSTASTAASRAVSSMRSVADVHDHAGQREFAYRELCSDTSVLQRIDERVDHRADQHAGRRDRCLEAVVAARRRNKPGRW